MIVYVQLKQETKTSAPTSRPTPGSWFPWTECKSEDETVRIAIHRWMRQSGYINPRATFTEFPLIVFSYVDGAPMNTAGDQPLSCNRTEYLVLPN